MVFQLVSWILPYIEAYVSILIYSVPGALTVELKHSPLEYYTSSKGSVFQMCNLRMFTVPCNRFL
jgi:hypothetical protein